MTLPSVGRARKTSVILAWMVTTRSETAVSNALIQVAKDVLTIQVVTCAILDFGDSSVIRTVKMGVKEVFVTIMMAIVFLVELVTIGLEQNVYHVRILTAIPVPVKIVVKSANLVNGVLTVTLVVA